MNIRRGNTVARVGTSPEVEATAGQVCTLESKEYESINQAKKANGLNARVLRKGERFPPTVREMMEAAE